MLTHFTDIAPTFWRGTLVTDIAPSVSGVQNLLTGLTPLYSDVQTIVTDTAPSFGGVLFFAGLDDTAYFRRWYRACW